MTQRPAPSLIEQADAAGIVLFSSAIALPDDGTAPEWITLFPKTGRVETRDGRAFDVSAATLMAAFTADAIDIPIDVNHSTDAAAMFGGRADAVGWGTELREHDGALQIKADWLAEGRELLSARKYRYTSPSFYQDKNRATRLKAVALVTSPALARQPSLAHAGGNLPDAPLKALAVALGLPEAAGMAECLSAATTLRANVVPRAEHEAVVAQLAAMQTTNHQAAVDALLEGALKSMKIVPAEREAYASLCATAAGLDQIQRLFANKSPIFRPSGLDGRTPPGAHDAGEETPITLAARATRYREAQERAGSTLSQADAIAYAVSNPNAGR